MINQFKIIFAGLVGAGLATLYFSFFQTSNDESVNDESTGEKQPLYWVAPMDANYRRDKPGKSPMGMDLIPVYEESSSDGDYGPGAVKIAPHIVNNLGVRTANATVKQMDTSIATVGYVQYDEDQLIHIHPRVDGWIEKLYVKAAGNPVEKGQPLYTLYSPQLVTAQEELLIALKRNNFSLISAAKDRLKALQLSDAFIRNLEASKKVHQTITFYSPQSGVIDGLKIREGFYVKPGNTLLSIAKLDQVWVEAEIFERDAPLIAQGLPVSMTLDYLPAKTWRGVVDYVYPSLNQATRTLRVRLKFDNIEQQLKPNMYAQITIHAEQGESRIVVPKEAVIRTGKQDRVVLALGEGRFKSVEVNVGRVNHQEIEILSGLDDGDLVVTSAQFLIDSESSKTSDFKRMVDSDEPNSLWMEGLVNRVNTGKENAQSTVNITHGPAPAWGWPEMTMDFNLAPEVDVNRLEAGQSLHFEVTKSQDDGYRITGIHIMSEASVSSATVEGVINSVSIDSRVLNISRDAIEKWNRPAATMDFIAAENIDLTGLKEGQRIKFTFEIHDDFIIVDINAMANMDHSQHINH